jgi:hypothetical protein
MKNLLQIVATAALLFSFTHVAVASSFPNYYSYPPGTTFKLNVKTKSSILVAGSTRTVDAPIPASLAPTLAVGQEVTFKIARNGALTIVSPRSRVAVPLQNTTSALSTYVLSKPRQGLSEIAYVSPADPESLIRAQAQIDITKFTVRRGQVSSLTVSYTFTAP